MCSRYELTVNAGNLAAVLSRLLGRSPRLPGTLDAVLGLQAFRPTDRAPVLLIDAAGEAAVGLVPWGWPAPWDGSPLFNARIERLAEAPSFRPHLGRRCLVPATAWTEGRGRGRVRIGRSDGGLLTMAGLYGRDAAGNPAFTVITRPAVPAIAHIHPRMPALIDDADQAMGWLDPATSAAAALGLLDAAVAPGLSVAEAVPAAAMPDLFGGSAPSP